MCFFRFSLTLSLYPVGLKEGVPLAMYPCVVLPYPCTLRTFFSSRYCFYPGVGGKRSLTAQGYVTKGFFLTSPNRAMDFSNAGATERIGDAFRAHINWRVGGKQRNAYGPRRPDEDAAKDDLDAMRAVASGMSREDGFAAMAAEAERLKAGKPPSKQGSVEHLGDGYRARVDWRATGEMRQVHGPRRAEEKRAQADLEAMREAASMHDDVLQSRIAIFIRARYLQQQAEAERRVELFAHRRDKAQRAAEEEECDSGSDNSHMDFEAYEELDEEDDGMVDYAWKSSARSSRRRSRRYLLFLNLHAQTRPHCCWRSYRRRRVAGALSHVPFRD